MKKVLFILTQILAFITLGQKENLYCSELNALLKTAGTFPFGVASGDPSDQGMILLTQLNPFRFSGLSNVQCQLSENEAFTEVYRRYQTTVRYESAYSAKIYAYGLAAGKTYYYRFIYGEDTSMVGRTKTLPKNPANIRFAVVSCSNYEWGWFNAYESLSKDKALDFVIHLGDYIYEHGVGTYGNEKLPRKHLPSHEIVSLVDYRSRYAQYRMDPQLQALHQNLPFISVWDDHEIANDAFSSGAQNHQAEEGAWRLRKENAQKAYFEWLPIQDHTQNQVRRSFHLGTLMDLYMLDERLEGRTKPLESLDGQTVNLEQTMLGKAQRTWLVEEMKEHYARWKVIGNQVLFSSMNVPSHLPAIKKSTDMWDGYAGERSFLFETWQEQSEKNLIVLTGDAHVSFGIDLQHNGQSLGAEWVTPSVTSANLNEKLSSFNAWRVERYLKKPEVNPTLNFINLRRHGYMVVTLTEEKATCAWHFVKTLKKPSAKSKKKATREILWRP
ncbi:MAG: alkaline phosphatase D family protein [Flavobacteriales bacterium]